MHFSIYGLHLVGLDVFLVYCQDLDTFPNPIAVPIVFF